MREPDYVANLRLALEVAVPAIAGSPQFDQAKYNPLMERAIEVFNGHGDAYVMVVCGLLLMRAIEIENNALVQ